MVCRDYGQYGHETEEIVSKIIGCIANRTNYVFISLGFCAFERVRGNYSNLKSLVSVTLEKNFECLDIEQHPGSKFYTRTSFQNDLRSSEPS